MGDVRIWHWTNSSYFLGGASNWILRSKGKNEETLVVAGDTFARNVDRDRVDDDGLKKEAMKVGDDNVKDFIFKSRFCDYL